jgi:hypothetical protein
MQVHASYRQGLRAKPALSATEVFEALRTPCLWLVGVREQRLQQTRVPHRASDASIDALMNSYSSSRRECPWSSIEACAHPSPFAAREVPLAQSLSDYLLTGRGMSGSLRSGSEDGHSGLQRHTPWG